jgi:hypothetical protein
MMDDEGEELQIIPDVEPTREEAGKYFFRRDEKNHRNVMYDPHGYWLCFVEMDVDVLPPATHHEEAVRRSYKASVTEAEYREKATPDVVKQVAHYFEVSGYDPDLFDDTSHESPNTDVQLLIDFVNYTKGME